jgi:hypothetical protein
MLPHFLDSRLTDGGKVTVRRRSPFMPKKISGTHFCQKLSRLQGLSAVGRIRPIETCSDIMGTRTGDLPACSSASTNYATVERWSNCERLIMERVRRETSGGLFEDCFVV